MNSERRSHELISARISDRCRLISLKQHAVGSTTLYHTPTGKSSVNQSLVAHALTRDMNDNR